MGALFGAAQSSAASLAPAPVPVAPTMNNAAVQQAQQNQITAEEETSGRQSTILTDNANRGTGNTLG